MSKSMAESVVMRTLAVESQRRAVVAAESSEARAELAGADVAVSAARGELLPPTWAP